MGLLEIRVWSIGLAKWSDLGDGEFVWQWASGQGNMTWDLLLLCNGLGPVGTILSDSKCAMRFIWGSRYLASISRLRNLLESIAVGALTFLGAFLLQSSCWSQTTWFPRSMSLRKRPRRPTRTFHICSTSEPPVACAKTLFPISQWTNFLLLCK